MNQEQQNKSTIEAALNMARRKGVKVTVRSMNGFYTYEQSKPSDDDFNQSIVAIVYPDGAIQKR